MRLGEVDKMLVRICIKMVFLFIIGIMLINIQACDGCNGKFVSGTVRDASTGSYLPSVKVTCQNNEIYTKSNGTFSIKIPKSNVTIEFEKKGYQKYSYVAPKSSSSSINIRLEPVMIKQTPPEQPPESTIVITEPTQELLYQGSVVTFFNVRGTATKLEPSLSIYILINPHELPGQYFIQKDPAVVTGKVSGEKNRVKWTTVAQLGNEFYAPDIGDVFTIIAVAVLQQQAGKIARVLGKPINLGMLEFQLASEPIDINVVAK